MADVLTRFLQAIRESGDLRGFTADLIAADLRRMGALEEDDELKIRRANFLKKTEELIDILKKRSASNPNIVFLFKEALKGRMTQCHLAKLLDVQEEPADLLTNRSPLLSSLSRFADNTREPRKEAPKRSNNPPIILEQPNPVHYCKLGERITLHVGVDESKPVRYQWYTEGNPVTGQESKAMSTSTAGEYFCRITSNDDISVDSQHVKVTVVKRLAEDGIPSDELEEYYQNKDLIVTVPSEILAHGEEARKEYFEALSDSGGGMECPRARLMVVGRDRAGKTSLVHALLGDFLKKEHEEKPKQSTDGIEFTLVKCRSDGGDPEYSFAKADESDNFLERERARVIAYRVHEKMGKSRVESTKQTTAAPTSSKDSAPDPPAMKNTPELRELPSEMKKFVAEEMKKLIKSHGERDTVKYLMLRISDFAGQPVYLNSHVPFLSKHGVYVLVHNLVENLKTRREPRLCRKDKTKEYLVGFPETKTNEQYVESWLTAIGSTCLLQKESAKKRNEENNSPSVLVVGTRLDEFRRQTETWSQFASSLERKQMALNDYLRTRCADQFSLLEKKEFCIDNTGTLHPEGRELRRLRRTIVENACRQPTTNQILPFTWIEMELELLSLRKQQKRCISVEELKKHFQSRGVGIAENGDGLSAPLQYFHDIGVVVYFGKSDKDSAEPEYVVVDPDWLVRVFRSIVSAHSADEMKEAKLERISRFGIISYDDILSNLEKENVIERKKMNVVMELLQKYSFLSPYLLQSPVTEQRTAEYFLAPSMVTFDPPAEFVFSELLSEDQTEERGSVAAPSLYFRCESGHLPAGLYSRLATRMALHYPVCPEVFYNFARFHFDEKFDVIIANWSNVNTVATKSVRDKIFMTVADVNCCESTGKSIKTVCKEVYCHFVFALHDICEIGMKGLRFSAWCGRKQRLYAHPCLDHEVESCSYPGCFSQFCEGVKRENPTEISYWIPDSPDSFKNIGIPVFQGKDKTLPSVKLSTVQKREEGLIVQTSLGCGKYEWRRAGIVEAEEIAKFLKCPSMDAAYSCRLIMNSEPLGYSFTLPFFSVSTKQGLRSCRIESDYDNNVETGEDLRVISYEKPVTLRCRLEDCKLDEESLKFQWCFEDRELIGETSKELCIPKMRDYRTGAYCCKVRDRFRKCVKSDNIVLLDGKQVCRTTDVTTVELKESIKNLGLCRDKVALLIGNQKYEHHDNLDAPEKDIADIGKVLKDKFQFNVLTLSNLTYFEVVIALEKFYSLIDPGSYALVFYAGHGFECERLQYLTPVDADESLPIQTAVSAQSIRFALEMAGAKLIYIVFDCCRIIKNSGKNSPKVPHVAEEVLGYAHILKSCQSDGIAQENTEESWFKPVFVGALEALQYNQDCSIQDRSILKLKEFLYQKANGQNRSLHFESTDIGGSRTANPCVISLFDLFITDTHEDNARSLEKLTDFEWKTESGNAAHDEFIFVVINVDFTSGLVKCEGTMLEFSNGAENINVVFDSQKTEIPDYLRMKPVQDGLEIKNIRKLKKGDILTFGFTASYCVKETTHHFNGTRKIQRNYLFDSLPDSQTFE